MEVSALRSCPRKSERIQASAREPVLIITCSSITHKCKKIINKSTQSAELGDVNSSPSDGQKKRI